MRMSHFVGDRIGYRRAAPSSQSPRIHTTMPTLDPRGTYEVFYVGNNGDTHGQTWYTEMVCSAINGTALLSGAAR